MSATVLGLKDDRLIVLELRREPQEATRRHYEGRVTDLRVDDNGKPFAVQISTNGTNRVWVNMDHVEKWWSPTSGR